MGGGSWRRPSRLATVSARGNVRSDGDRGGMEGCRPVASVAVRMTGLHGELKGEPLGAEALLNDLHDVFGIAPDRAEAP